MAKRLGYLEGVDSAVLTKLAVAGVETVPLGNGWDNYGRYVGHINLGDGYKAVVGYLHKFLPTSDSELTAADMLKPCIVHKIPVFVLAAKEDHAAAAKALGDAGDAVKVLDPADAAAELAKVLK